jgi:hypothetical protein
MNENEYFLIYFDCDHSYDVIRSSSSSLRNVNRENKIAEISFKGKWLTGCIKTKGTFKFN